MQFHSSLEPRRVCIVGCPRRSACVYDIETSSRSTSKHIDKHMINCCVESIYILYIHTLTPACTYKMQGKQKDIPQHPTFVRFGFSFRVGASRIGMTNVL